MIDALSALPGRFDGHPQARHRLLLADVFLERAGTELALELRLLGRGHAAEDALVVRGGLTHARVPAPR